MKNGMAAQAVRSMLLAISMGCALPVPAGSGDSDSIGGQSLSVVRWGNPAGQPVLLLRDLVSAPQVWHYLQDPALVARYRFVSLDARRRDAADAPAQRWAADMAVVVAAERLEHPVIIDSSAGGKVALSFVRDYGQKNLAGIVFVPTAGDPGETALAPISVPKLFLAGGTQASVSEAPRVFSRELMRFVESTRAPDQVDPALSIIRGFLAAHNRHDADAAVAFYHDDASFALSEERGVVTGREGLLGLELLDAQLGSWLSPHGLRVRREGEDTVVSLDYVVEQSDIAQAVGVPLIVAEAVTRAFVLRNGRFRRVEQPAFAPPCARAMGSGFMGFIGWMHERKDPRRRQLLRPGGGIVLTEATAPQWIAGIREWRSLTGWSPNADDVLACARYEPLPAAVSPMEGERR